METHILSPEENVIVTHQVTISRLHITIREPLVGYTSNMNSKNAYLFYLTSVKQQGKHSSSILIF